MLCKNGFDSQDDSSFVAATTISSSEHAALQRGQQQHVARHRRYIPVEKRRDDALRLVEVESPQLIAQLLGHVDCKRIDAVVHPWVGHNDDSEPVADATLVRVDHAGACPIHRFQRIVSVAPREGLALGHLRGVLDPFHHARRVVPMVQAHRLRVKTQILGGRTPREHATDQHVVSLVAQVLHCGHPVHVHVGAKLGPQPGA